MRLIPIIFLVISVSAVPPEQQIECETDNNVHTETRLYEVNFDKWKDQQASFLETKQFDKLDVENLIHEIYGMAKSELQSLEFRLEKLLLHLLKYKCQPDYEPKGWLATIREQRRAIMELINEHPFLRGYEEPTLEDVCESIMQRKGKFYASKLHIETRGAVNAKNLFMAYMDDEKCLWPFDKIMDDEFFPERTGKC